MPHRDAAERAAWLRMLARDLPALSETSTLAVRQTVDTLNEIAEYLDETEPGRLPPDTLWTTIHVHGPALWYFNNEDDTLTQIRLDKPGLDPSVVDERERAIYAALVRLAHNRLNASEFAG